MGGRLCSDAVARSGLSPSDRDRLYSIFERHYEGVSRERFESDLAEKDFVILLREGPRGPVQGFSTQRVMALDHGGARVRAVFSGDTVIDRAYWGEQELVRGWCRFAGRVKAAEPETPLYWFLITKGYRTYLYLPLFFRDYYPRSEGPTPAGQKALLDALALSKFPSEYDPATGLIVPEGGDRLRPELAETPEGRRDDPRVSFYLAKNPRYAQGDELVSLTEIRGTNMKGIAARSFAEGLALGSLQKQESLAP
ncbi:MAG: hypothetical protein HY077_03715 [Elusimicrobia bacterium]|nr:hypothetical protein [Elusimicrobiota bacterium]